MNGTTSMPKSVLHYVVDKVRFVCVLLTRDKVVKVQEPLPNHLMKNSET